MTELERALAPPGYVRRIRTENIWHAAREAIMPFVGRLVDKPETIGVVALSGLADRVERHFLDTHSDIDLALFITIPEACGFRCAREFARDHPDLLPPWLPAFSFMIQVDHRSTEVNCRQLILEIEEHPERNWPSPKQEAFGATGEVLHDPTGRVAEIIRAKCNSPSSAQVAWLASQLPWCGWLNPAAQLDRGLYLNVKILLNRAVEILVELLFIAVDRHPPAPEWRLEAALDLPELPIQFESRVRAVLEADCMPDSLAAAIDVFRSLGTEVLMRVNVAGLLPPDPYRYASIHAEDDKQLLPVTTADSLGDLASFLLLAPGEELPDGRSSGWHSYPAR